MSTGLVVGALVFIAAVLSAFVLSTLGAATFGPETPACEFQDAAHHVATCEVTP
jgi:hypothetical protein